MSKKQFYYGIFDDGTEYIEDYKKGEYYFDLNDVEELLNELLNKYNILKEENKQLRNELNDCEKFRYTVFKRIGELVE